MNSEPLDAVSLATRLRLLRTQLGFSQEQLSNKEIAVRLYLSPGTVERHLATIYHKLGSRRPGRGHPLCPGTRAGRALNPGCYSAIAPASSTGGRLGLLMRMLPM